MWSPFTTSNWVRNVAHGIPLASKIPFTLVREKAQSRCCFLYFIRNSVAFNIEKKNEEIMKRQKHQFYFYRKGQTIAVKLMFHWIVPRTVLETMKIYKLRISLRTTWKQFFLNNLSRYCVSHYFAQSIQVSIYYIGLLLKNKVTGRKER